MLIVTGKLKKLWVKCSEWMKYRVITLVALALGIGQKRVGTTEIRRDRIVGQTIYRLPDRVVGSEGQVTCPGILTLELKLGACRKLELGYPIGNRQVRDQDIEGAGVQGVGLNHG